MNDSKKTGIITLENLKEDGRIYAILNKDFLNIILLELKKFGKHTKDVSKKTGIRYTLLSSLAGNRQRAVKLKDIWNICMFLKKNSMNYFPQLSKSILELRGQNGNGIKNPKLPINFNNKKGARVIASLYGDGGVDKNTNRPLYANKVKELIDNLLKCIKEVIGEVYYTSYNNKECIQITFSPILGFIYEKAGYQPGNKVETPIKIPSFVYKLEKNLILEFLSQLIDDEGHVYYGVKMHKQRNKLQPRSIYSVRLTFSNNYNGCNVHVFFNSLLKLLHKIEIYPSYKRTNIYTTKDNRKREKWTMSLSGKGFYQNIKKLNLIIPYKRRNLNKIISSIKEIHMSKYELNIIVPNIIKNMEQNSIEINSFNFCKELDLSVCRAREILKKFYKQGHIIKILGKRKFKETKQRRFAGQTSDVYRLNFN